MNLMPINLSVKGGNQPTYETFNGIKYKLFSGRNWNLNYIYSSKYERIKSFVNAKKYMA